MLLHHIDHALEVIKGMATDPELRDEQLTGEQRDMWISGNIMLADHMAKEIQLQSTHDRVWPGGGSFWMKSNVGLTWQEAYNELRVLRQAIESDLQRRTFAFVVPAKAEFLDRMEEDWQSVWTALPDTKEDVVAAMECYALEQDTASVFHLMRVVEWGLRAFCYHLGFKSVKRKIKKTGKVELTSIEYSTWEGILNQLRGKVNDRLGKLRRGSKKQQLQEFYNPVLSEIEAFKDAWRNHVMHTRKTYGSDDVLAIMSHVRRFMNLLVANGVTRA